MLIFPKSRSRRGGRLWSRRRGRLSQRSSRPAKPEPELRGSDIFAMVIAGLQVILPYFFMILAAIVGTYLLVAAFFGMS